MKGPRSNQAPQWLEAARRALLVSLAAEVNFGDTPDRAMRPAPGAQDDDLAQSDTEGGVRQLGSFDLRSNPDAF